MYVFVKSKMVTLSIPLGLRFDFLIEVAPSENHVISNIAKKWYDSMVPNIFFLKKYLFKTTILHVKICEVEALALLPIMSSIKTLVELEAGGVLYYISFISLFARVSTLRGRLRPLEGLLSSKVPCFLLITKVKIQVFGNVINSTLLLLPRCSESMIDYLYYFVLVNNGYSFLY